MLVSARRAGNAAGRGKPAKRKVKKYEQPFFKKTGRFKIDKQTDMIFLN
jgi:hypothetical protein